MLVEDDGDDDDDSLCNESWASFFFSVIFNVVHFVAQ